MGTKTPSPDFSASNPDAGHASLTLRRQSLEAFADLERGWTFVGRGEGYMCGSWWEGCESWLLKSGAGGGESTSKLNDDDVENVAHGKDTLRGKERSRMKSVPE